MDNLIRHGTATPPPAAPPLVRELLAGPLAAADAATLFYRAVPGALRRLVEEASEEPRASRDPALVSLRGLLDVYLGELAEAQRMLRAAARGAPTDAQALIPQLRDNLPAPSRLRDIAGGLDQAALDRATTLFLNATARFVHGMRAAGASLAFPAQAMRFESAVGAVVIGTRGDDVHGPDAAVIIDPGGNDVYTRAPATGGAISVIVDLGGDDRYLGSDVAVHGLSAIIDFSGNDRYTMAGPGLGAAIAGAALLLDFAGDDAYEADLFGQGAAALGLGAVVDLGGNDTYRLRAGGQGFGLAGGVGLLWDRSGNDTYVAGGLPDAFGRGGGTSWAQGAALGYRVSLGGGIGILRDDAGNDSYSAEMFTQGTAYYYGLALLWDGGGDDRYRAVRYAQGNGVHEAVGVLRDESGNDRYELTFGVGQGMGLDLAVGVLFDGAGDDDYRAPLLAQGAATANGLGILADAGGADRWHVDDPQRVWGRADWSRELPTIGLLLYDPARAVFTRKEGAESAPPENAGFGAPLGPAPVKHEATAGQPCATVAPAAAADSAMPLAEALRRIAPGFAGERVDPELYADVQRRLTTRLEASLAELPRDDFTVAWSLGEALRCALISATDGEAAAMWDAMERALATERSTLRAGVIAGALGERPAPAPQMERMLAALDARPACGLRVAALRLRHAAASDGPSRASVTAAAQAALRSPCWRLQASARAVHKQLGVAPDPGVVLPSFLRSE